MNFTQKTAKTLIFTVLSSLGGYAQQYTPHSLASHGYLRTGFGRSLPKGEMVQFQLPETNVKSRFGNEANHYAELQFNYKYQEQNASESYEMVYMMTQYSTYKDLNLTSGFSAQTSQFYLKWNNFYKDMDIWVGKRYYQRLNVEVLDFFWLNPVQNADVGVGIEQISLGAGAELDLALMRFSDKPNYGTVNQEIIEHFKFDARSRNIPVSQNFSLNFIGQIGYRPEVENTPYNALWGYSLGGWSQYEKSFFYNRNSLIFRKGINMIENPYSGKSFLEFTSGGERLYNLASAHDVQLTSDFRYDNLETFGFLGAVSYHYKDYGIKTSAGNNRLMQHLNLTGRFSRYLTTRFRLTADTSFDYVNITDTAHGGLLKITLSPELSWRKGMFSRPSFRPFITYAHWAESLKGKVGVFNGNDIFKEKTNGFTLGLQMEVWW